MSSPNQMIHEGYLTDSWKRFSKNKMAMASVFLLTTLILFSIFLPLFTKNTYYETQLNLKNMSPNFTHFFGTDDLGRSMYARIWWGARISLFVGIVAALIDMVIGVTYGAFAGPLWRENRRDHDAYCRHFFTLFPIY